MRFLQLSSFPDNTITIKDKLHQDQCTIIPLTSLTEWEKLDYYVQTSAKVIINHYWRKLTITNVNIPTITKIKYPNCKRLSREIILLYVWIGINQSNGEHLKTVFLPHLDLIQIDCSRPEGWVQKRYGTNM